MKPRLWLLAGALTLATNVTCTDTVVLSTYYPAPSGVYARMLTTNDTYLARDGGFVGVGTGVPVAKLDVAGTVRIADGTEGPGKVLVSDGIGRASWQSPAGITACVTQVAPGPGVVSCPAGYFAVGGGIDFAGMGDHGGYTSHPSGPASWTCGYDNRLGGTGTESVVSCYAQCCR